MGRKKWSTKFVDLRGRWQDNPGIVERIVTDAKTGKDWTHRLIPFLVDDSGTAVPRGHGYENPPDLRQIILDKQDLSGAQFPKANMAGATAYRCFGRKLNCERATLVNSKLGNSVLRDGIFRNAHARRAYLGHCDLARANFDGADLRYASFRKARLDGTSFRGADLRGAHLTDASCEGADFSGSKLYGAALWNLSYDRVVADSVDISPEGDSSVLSINLPLAPLIHYLTHDKHLAEIISVIKLKTAVVLGCDSTPKALEVLRTIAVIGRNSGVAPILVKDQKEIPAEPFLKKAQMYSLLARYVILENSYAAGQIVELDKVLADGCVVAVLQEKGKGSTWLLEEKFVQYTTVKRFWYESNTLEEAAKHAYSWCEQKIRDLGVVYSEAYGNLDLKYVDPRLTRRLSRRRDGVMK